MSFTIGSLFDGSGGFPLAATMCGGKPKWASEIEPYPIAVTKSRFPDVKHLGSVTDIKGSEIEPVDVITFGSPCQDLSVAGKRAGLKHEANGDDETTRSGLFMEAVRIIKEMREATNGVYPRFAVWENVPGAFSSNKGEDFRIVLQELIQVAEPTAVMPEVPEKGWPYADSYCGDGWSIAYRVLDAQYWGVPQRRRRIYLVADFRGECARKVSFEREGLRGYFETGGTPWQTATGDAEAGSGATDSERNCLGWPLGFRPENVRVYDEVATTICNGTRPGFTCGVIEVIPTYAIDQQGGKGGANYAEDVMPTLCSDSHGTPHAVAYPYTLKIRSGCEGGGKGALIQEDMSATLATNNDQYLFQPVMTVLDDQGGSQISVRDDGKCPTLRAEMHGNVPSVMEPIPIHDQATRFSGKRGDNCDGKGNGLGVGNPGDPMNTLTSGDRHAVVYALDEKMGQTYVYDDQVHTLSARDYKQPKTICYAMQAFGKYTETDKASAMKARDYKDATDLVAQCANKATVQYIVRRLTPTECARLQGFPDTWGHPIEKTEFTDEEYQFWLNVRNTHAAINDKATKEYTKDQILKWYNSLHTDSSEYKMWGNGIALPNAMYVMQGIADVMSEEKAARRKWLNDLLGDCL